MFIDIVREFVSNVDPLDGIIADIEDNCEVSEEGRVAIDHLVAYFEKVNWLDASKDAIMEIVGKHKNEEGSVDYLTALCQIIQD